MGAAVHLDHLYNLIDTAEATIGISGPPFNVSTAANEEEPSCTAGETQAPHATSPHQLSKTLTVKQQMEQHAPREVGPLAMKKHDNDSTPPVFHGDALPAIGHPLDLGNPFTNVDKGVTQDLGEAVKDLGMCANEAGMEAEANLKPRTDEFLIDSDHELHDKPYFFDPKTQQSCKVTEMNQDYLVKDGWSEA
jgi:hypothetical protein